jgi:hypothetical protein
MGNIDKLRFCKTTFLLLSTVVAVLLTSCAPFGTSKRDRVLRFEADLNSSREYLYQNFLESETTQYEVIRDEDTACTWDKCFPVGFPEAGTYTITLDTFFGNPLEATVEGPAVFGGPKPMEFNFTRSGVYWYLTGITLDGVAWENLFD